MAKEKKAQAEAVRGSVRDKKIAIEAETKKIAEGKAKMEDAIKAEARKFVKEAKEMLKEGKDRMEKAVKEFNTDIEDQKKENQAAIKKTEAAIGKLERDIKVEQAEFEDYAKLFWG